MLCSTSAMKGREPSSDGYSPTNGAAKASIGDKHLASRSHRPLTHPCRHLPCAWEVDHAHAGDVGRPSDFVQRTQWRLVIDVQDADGVAARRVGGSADGHLGDIDLVLAADRSGLSDDGRHVAMRAGHPDVVE